MKRFAVFSVLVLALILTAACTRSAPTPLPASNNGLAGTVEAVIATQTAVAAVQTEDAQVARASSTTEPFTPTVTVTPTPEMVFIDPLTAKENADARWVIERDVMRPKVWEPLTFAPKEAYTRGDMAMAVARMCLKDPLGEPLGFFTDLKPLVASVNANAEQIRQAEHNKVLAAVSEELYRKGLYLARDRVAASDSESEKMVQADEWLRWVALAMTSPNCAGAKAQTSQYSPTFSEKASEYLAVVLDRIDELVPDVVTIPCDNSKLVAGVVGVIPWQWGKDAFVWVFDRGLEVASRLPWIGQSCIQDSDCNYGYRCENGTCQPYCTWGSLTGGVCCKCIDDGSGPRYALQCANPPGTGSKWIDNSDHPACPARSNPTNPPPAPTNTPPGPTNTPVPPTATPRPPTNTPPPVPPSATPKPGGGDHDKEPTKTPKPYYPPVTSFCPDDALVGSCGFNRIQAAGLWHENLADWVFPPNQLPPFVP